MGLEREKVIISLPRPQTKKGLQEFLGAAGFYCIWTPGFSAIEKPLYDLLGGLDWELPAWTEEAKAAFTEMKAALGQAPALGLADIEKSLQSLCT